MLFVFAMDFVIDFNLFFLLFCDVIRVGVG